ncbi:hypothetical protein FJM67_16795 [Maribrevibacterium harenarium]|uniref:Uncharacterized protein n=1 Tax=Maribrevibacterium harenarium TaxID=2589817 RepID=A0A501WBL9_9GAMM|nr:hypothetical protein [Maribrevibacterium harenarium]TPE44601.1 hypothetical protein FJM67_16795 [Maribrevibacterium harenarium]
MSDFHNKIRCFGSKGVFQIEHIFDFEAINHSQPDNTSAYNGSATKLTGDKVKRPTLGIEVSPVSNQTALYERKTSLELSMYEIMRMASVLLGYAPGAEFRRPGKTIAFQRQHQRIYISASGTKGHAALPMDMEHTALVSIFVLRHLSTTLQADTDAIISAIRGAYALIQTSNTA